MNPAAADDWLTRYSGEHLLHEFKMFWWLRENIPPDDGYLHDAVVESFVLHLRNLIDFFYPRKTSQKTDVIATDFMDNPGDWDSPTSVSASLEAARGRADKELSHLTDKRKYEGDPTKSWETDALFAKIKSVAEKFAGKASPKKLHTDVRELLTSPTHLVVSVLAAHSHSTNVTARDITGPVSNSTATWRKGP